MRTQRRTHALKLIWFLYHSDAFIDFSQRPSYKLICEAIISIITTQYNQNRAQSIREWVDQRTASTPSSGVISWRLYIASVGPCTGVEHKKVYMGMKSIILIKNMRRLWSFFMLNSLNFAKKKLY